MSSIWFLDGGLGLAAEAVGEFVGDAVGAGVGGGGVVVGEVVEAGFDGYGALVVFGAEELEAGAEVEDEVEGFSVGDGDGAAGVHVAEGAAEEGLQRVVGAQGVLEADGGEGLAEGPLAATGNGVGFRHGDPIEWWKDARTGAGLAGSCERNRVYFSIRYGTNGRKECQGYKCVCDLEGVALEEDGAEFDLVVEVRSPEADDAAGVCAAEVGEDALASVAHEDVAGGGRVFGEEGEGVFAAEGVGGFCVRRLLGDERSGAGQEDAEQGSRGETVHAGPSMS